jgi:hypothetical protein
MFGLHIEVDVGLTLEIGEQEFGDWLADLVVQSTNHNWKRGRH